MAARIMKTDVELEMPHAEFVTVTPDLAKKWLQENPINRNLKKKQVEALTKAIIGGVWDDCNGESIIISHEGHLLDGQHRLTAVVNADVPIVSLVVFGVSPKKRGTIDTGHKRSFGDFLTMRGETNTNQLAAACSVLCNYERGTLRSANRGSPFHSYDEGVRFLEDHPYLRDGASIANKFKHLFPASWGAAFISLFIQKDAIMTNKVIQFLGSGEYTSEFPTMRILKEKLIRNRFMQLKLPFVDLGAFLVKAWNAERSGIVIKLFKFLPDELFPIVK